MKPTVHGSGDEVIENRSETAGQWAVLVGTVVVESTDDAAIAFGTEKRISFVFIVFGRYPSWMAAAAANVGAAALSRAAGQPVFRVDRRGTGAGAGPTGG